MNRQFRVAAENLMGRGPYSTPGFATPLEPVLTIAVVTGDETITEGESAEFTVTASPRAFSASLGVTVKLSGGAAFGVAEGDQTFQLDLRGSSGNSSSANFSVTTSNDVVDDPDSTLTVTLEDTAAYALGDPLEVQVAVQDNDARPGAALIQSVVPGGWQLTVSWTAPADPGYSDGAADSHTDNAVTAYDVRHIRSDETDDDAWTVADDAWQTGGGDLTYTIGGLTAGTQYNVQVRAVTQAGEGDWSGTTTGTPVAGDAMTVSLTPGVGQLRADWSAVAQATGYVVQWRAGGQQYLDTGTERRHVITDGSTTTYTITNLTPGTRYWVRVTPTRSGEPDGAPSEANAVAQYPAPGQVQNVSVTAQPGALGVTWDRVNDADGYKAQWKSGSEDFDESRQAALDGRNITSHTIRGLLPGTQYTVRVIATRRHAADGQPSAEATGTPQNVAPTSIPHTWTLLPSDLGEGDSFRLLFVTSGTRDATSSSISDYNTFVQNAANANGVDAVLKGFRTQFNALGCTETTDANANTGTTFTDQDKGLPIYWVNGAKVADDYQDFYDDSWNSNEPRNELGQTFNGNITVWTGCQNDGTEAMSADETKSRALGGPDADTLLVASADPKNKDRTIRGVDTVRTQEKRLYALSPVLTVAGAPPGLPGQPSVTRTADAAGATATLTWNAPTDSGSSAITGYNVQYRAIQSGTCGESDVVFTDWTDVADAGTDATATISMLAHSSHYQAQVRAVNGAGAGIWSAEAGFDTPHGPPTGVMGQAGSPGEAALSWTAPGVGNACNTDIDRFVVEYDDDNNLAADTADTTPPQTAQTADGDTTTLTVSGLTAGTEYFFRVRAVNAVGQGAYSTAVSFTPVTNNPPAFGADSYGFDLAENADGSSTAVAVGTVSATDPDTGDTVEYSITAGNTGSVFAIDGSSGAITYTGSGEDYESFTDDPMVDDDGPAFAYTLTAQASDGTADVTVPVTIRVTNVNEAPTANAGPDQSVTEGATVTLAGTGTDPEGQTLTYDWTAPSGITLSSATVANPTFTAPDRTADYTLTFSLKVNDETSDSAADTVDISVTADNDAPGAPSLTDQTATVGQAFSYQFAAVTDPEGATPTYTAQIRTGGAGTESDPYTYGSLPSWLTFTAGTRTFSATPVAANVGTLTIRVTASDGISPTPATSSATFTLTVSAAPVTNNPPAFGADSYAFDLTAGNTGSGERRRQRELHRDPMVDDDAYTLTAQASDGTADVPWARSPTSATESPRATPATRWNTPSRAGNTGSVFDIIDGSTVGRRHHLHAGSGEDYESFTDVGRPWWTTTPGPAFAYTLTAQASDGTANVTVFHRRLQR